MTYSKNCNVFEKYQVQGVIFDCDGVLVDSEPYSCRALQKLFEKYFNIDIGNDFSQILGKSVQDCLLYYIKKHKLQNINSSLLESFYIEKEDMYKELARKKLKSFYGIPEIITYCLDSNIKISVASSGALDKISFSLFETGLLKYFSLITSKEEVKKGKPDPEIFLLSAKKMKINPKYCLVVEDSPAGILAGNKAGMLTVGVTNTFSRTLLQESKPVLIIDNILELITKPE